MNRNGSGSFKVGKLGSGLSIDLFARAIDPLNGLAQFGYDPNSNRLSVTDTWGSATTYT